MHLDPSVGGTSAIEKLGQAPGADWLVAGEDLSPPAVEQLPFTISEYEVRRKNVLERLSLVGADALIVFQASSVDYLCGYHSEHIASPQPILLSPERTTLCVPQSEVGRALVGSCPDHIVYYPSGEDGLALIIEYLASLLSPGARVALEFKQSSVPLRIVELLSRSGLKAVDGDYSVERSRLVLSAAEIECVRLAAIHTQKGVEAATQAARTPNATDSSVAAAIAAAVFEDANSAPSRGAPIVATGSRGGIPHATWNGTPLERGTTTFLEFAGAHHRYVAPVMRTLVHGELSQPEKRLAELAETMVSTVIDTAAAGVPCSEVARIVTQALGTLEDSIVFHYTYGYSVGLSHPPHWMDGAPFFITANNEEPLEEGMVFHVPGSLRSFGVAGVGLSQTILITKDGAESLTLGPAEPTYV